MAVLYPRMKVSMITFGAPRIGGKKFRLWANKLKNIRMFRYVYGRDAVPRISTNSMGYHHTGHTVWIHDDMVKIYWLHDGCLNNIENCEKDPRGKPLPVPNFWSGKLCSYREFIHSFSFSLCFLYTLWLAMI